MATQLVSAIAVVLQLAAMAIAIVNAYTTKRFWAWGLMFLAQAVLGWQRAMQLAETFQPVPASELSDSLLGLFVSAGIVVGLVALAKKNGSSLRLEALEADERALIRRQSRIAVFIGVLSFLGSGGAGFLALQASRERMMNTVSEWVERDAKRMASYASLVAERSPNDAIKAIEDLWHREPLAVHGAYLCAIDGDGNLLANTGYPDKVGKNISQAPVAASNGPRNFKELLAERRAWTGSYVALSGQRQITSFTPCEGTDLWVAVHVPRNGIHATILDQEAPWTLVLALLTVVLFPLALALLARSSLAAQRLYLAERDRADRQRAEVQNTRRMEAIGQLAGGVAHDFNNLLTVILANTTFLRSQPVSERGSGNDDKCLGAIEQASLQAASLTKHLLLFSRQGAAQAVTLNLNTELEDAESLLTRVVEEHIEIQVIGSLEALWVSIDPSQLKQVIMNLVINARDAMGQGGVLRVEALEETSPKVLELGSSRRLVGFSVSDTGSGIDEETASRVFEPFFTTKPIGKGTGLGLSTVYGIVKEAGGDVFVQSTPGEGSVFTVLFPSVDPPEARPPAAAQGHSFPALRGTTVLVCEDDEAVRSVIVRTLRQGGCNVLDTGTPREALQCIKESVDGINLLVTDVLMPESSGVDLAKSIQPLGIPVLLVSGYSPAVLGNHGYVLDASHEFLAKPFEPEALLVRVDGILRRSFDLLEERLRHTEEA